MSRFLYSHPILIFMKTILVDAIHCFVIKGEGIFQEMLDLLEQYPNPKIVLTGAPPERHAELGLDKVPYELFTQSFNPDKTEPQYYKNLLEKYDLTADDVIYFEHGEEACKSAESVGIKTYFYDDNEKDLVALKEFLDANL